MGPFHMGPTKKTKSTKKYLPHKFVLYAGMRPTSEEQINFEKKGQTLNGRLPLEDSSVFDDSVCVLIVMT